MNVTVSTANDRLSALIAQVGKGVAVTLTRRGKAVARLVPTSSMDGDRPPEAVRDELVALSRGVTLGPGLSLRELGRDRD